MHNIASDKVSECIAETERLALMVRNSPPGRGDLHSVERCLGQLGRQMMTLSDADLEALSERVAHPELRGRPETAILQDLLGDLLFSARREGDEVAPGRSLTMVEIPVRVTALEMLWAPGSHSMASELRHRLKRQLDRVLRPLGLESHWSGGLFAPGDLPRFGINDLESSRMAAATLLNAPVYRLFNDQVASPVRSVPNNRLIYGALVDPHGRAPWPGLVLRDELAAADAQEAIDSVLAGLAEPGRLTACATLRSQMVTPDVTRGDEPGDLEELEPAVAAG